MQRISYRPHAYGCPVIDSAAAKNVSVSANSYLRGSGRDGLFQSCGGVPTHAYGCPVIDSAAAKNVSVSPLVPGAGRGDAGVK
jgi:hypothetical protein